jgi:lipid-A-disaccharide synthase
MRIFLCAGEASGDRYAAALARLLVKKVPGVTLEGVGGPRLGAILDLLADSTRWGAISIVESLKVVGRILPVYARIRRRLAEGQPGIFIPIDFGFLNVRLARYAKQKGWKVLYFIPRGSWKHHHKAEDLRELKEVIDGGVSPFPWSAKAMFDAGMDVRFYGHPLKQVLRDESVKPMLNSKRIALLPGSREQEIARNLELMAEAVEGLGPFELEVAVAPTTSAESVRRTWSRFSKRAIITTEGDIYGVLSRARAAIVCSGTATLEASLMGVPMVVVYAASKAMQVEAKLIRFKTPKWISLPNITLQRDLVPEFVGVAIDGSEVRKAVAGILEDGPLREAQRQGLSEVDEILGPSNALDETVEWIRTWVET